MARVHWILLSLLLGACSSSQLDVEEPDEEEEVMLGTPSDEVDPKVVGDAVRQNPERFRRCYQIGRESNPSMAGRVEVRFLINEDGTVDKAAAVDSDLPSLVTRCVVTAFYSLQLPPQRTAVVAQYPVFFQPG